jgi:hypothetical protein
MMELEAAMVIMTTVMMAMITGRMLMGMISNDWLHEMMLVSPCYK